ncbi:hypothetical protein [Devosia sp. CAU 1758]
MKKFLTVFVLTACLLGNTIRVAGSESILQSFEQICLKTAGELYRIQTQIEVRGGWEAVQPDEHLVLKNIENNRTWYFQGKYELGMVVAGSLPVGDGDDRRLCMFAAPRGKLTIEDASNFLIDAGGQRALPAGDAIGQDVFFAHRLEGDLVMVGIHLIPDRTHLQFLLTDLPDDEVKDAIKAAEAEDVPAP